MSSRVLCVGISERFFKMAVMTDVVRMLETCY